MATPARIIVAHGTGARRNRTTSASQSGTTASRTLAACRIQITRSSYRDSARSNQTRHIGTATGVAA
jgi:hypothetical protein